MLLFRKQSAIKLVIIENLLVADRINIARLVPIKVILIFNNAIVIIAVWCDIVKPIYCESLIKPCVNSHKPVFAVIKVLRELALLF